MFPYENIIKAINDINFILFHYSAIFSAKHLENVLRSQPAMT